MKKFERMKEKTQLENVYTTNERQWSKPKHIDTECMQVYKNSKFI